MMCLLCFIFGHKNEEYTVTGLKGNEIECKICSRCHHGVPQIDYD